MLLLENVVQVSLVNFRLVTVDVGDTENNASSLSDFPSLHEPSRTLVQVSEPTTSSVKTQDAMDPK